MNDCVKDLDVGAASRVACTWVILPVHVPCLVRVLDQTRG